MNQLGIQTRTARGFPQIEFKDACDVNCALAASSLAEFEQPGTSAIWLGINEGKPVIMKQHAMRMGVKLPPGEVSGWMPYPLPSEVFISTRMHLRRGQVQALINHLEAWLESDSGEFALV
jgi:hypothetical protein